MKDRETYQERLLRLKWEETPWLLTEREADLIWDKLDPWQQESLAQAMAEFKELNYVPAE